MSSSQHVPALPQPELSPPASPWHRSHSQSDALHKHSKHRDLPDTPPTSLSPSHHSDDSHQTPSQAPVLSPPQSAPSPDVREMSSIDTTSQTDTTSQLPPTLPRTSSKHKLADEDDLQDEPNKRRRTDHDRNGPEKHDDLTAPAKHVATRLYRLSNQPIVASRPHPTQNLFSLYGLNPLASTVARKDPVTGEKINKLRKSYEGKIKDFAGKNKATDKEGEFFDLLMYPTDEWNIHHVQGKEMRAVLAGDGGGLSADFLKQLDSALDMSPGPLPPAERDKWRGIIDLDGSAAKPGQMQGHATSQMQDALQRTGKPPLEEAQRPKRRGTKRNYNDDAFEGYAEGYADDYMDELGADHGDPDDDRRSTISGSGASKRRRKEPHFSNSLPQYSPGAVSVGGNGR